MKFQTVFGTCMSLYCRDVISELQHNNTVQQLHSQMHICLKSMICVFRQKVVPPLHTSHRPSTEKHVWLGVSSTAQGTEWLKTDRQLCEEVFQ